MNAKLAIKGLLSRKFRVLPDESHCPECKIKENHPGVAVAFNVGVGQVELIIKGKDVFFTDKGMKFAGEFIFGAGKEHYLLFSASEIHDKVFAYHPQCICQKTLLSFPAQ